MGEALTRTETSLDAVHTGQAVRPVGASGLVALFSTTLFTSAFLMFLAEPMIARILLPVLGGAPAVWNTCLVFVQSMLVAEYGYAHVATRYFGVRRHLAVHAVVLLLPLAVLPTQLRHAPPEHLGNPTLWLLAALFGSIGLPFFVLSTSAALLQKWFSATDDGAAGDPYFLYAASNSGSFIALIAYPLLVEPNLRLQDQARLWTVGYVVLLLLSLTCAAVVWRRGVSTAARVAIDADAEPIAWTRRGRWVALAAVPSSLLLAVTNYISTDVASVPLLWVIPLALYLLTFLIVFRPAIARVHTIAARMMPLMLVILTLILIAEMTSPLWLIIPLHLLAFFVIAVTCHAQLAADRPSPARLTEFFFWTAFGGMVGGLFNALLAPVVFDSILEYPLVLVAACLLRPRPVRDRQSRPSRADWAIPLGICVAAATAVLVSNHFGSLSRFIILGAAAPALVAFAQQRHRLRFAPSIAVILSAGAPTQRPFWRVVYAAPPFFCVKPARVRQAPGHPLLFPRQ